MCQTHSFVSLHTVSLSFAKDVFIRLLLWADSCFSFIHGVLFIVAIMLICFFLAHSDSNHVKYHPSVSPFSLAQKAKGISFCNNICQWEIHLSVRKKIHRVYLGLFSIKLPSEEALLYKIMCSTSGCLRLSFFTVWMLFYFLSSPYSPTLFNSRQTQGALNESDDPETGCLSDNKPTSRHFYPVALLLVSSHLLVVWLILSLALLLAKYQ